MNTQNIKSAPEDQTGATAVSQGQETEVIILKDLIKLDNRRLEKPYLVRVPNSAHYSDGKVKSWYKQSKSIKHQFQND